MIFLGCTKPLTYSFSKPVFSEISINFSGQKKLLSETNFETLNFYTVDASMNPLNNQKACTVINTWFDSKAVHLANMSYSCEIISFQPQQEKATIAFKDIILKLTKENVEMVLDGKKIGTVDFK